MSPIIRLVQRARPSRRCLRRTYVTKNKDDSVIASSAAIAEGESISSCPPNTVLAGIAYLKDQPPLVALPDDEYPPWLWTLLKRKVLPDDGPGGKAEKVRLRKENRQRIREQNFLKTQ